MWQAEDFNSHAHVERDLNGNYVYGRTWDFNSHAHVERDNADETKFQEIINFNSHAHVERDQNLLTHVNNIFISTHTLTWSVTSATQAEPIVIGFQLTRSRGAWRI